MNNFQTINVNDINEVANSLNQLADWQDRTGRNSCQTGRYIKDSLVAIMLGADMVNENNSGWDYYFSQYNLNGENKNTKLSKNTDNLTAVLQDTSDEKVKEFKEGVLTSVSVWKNINTLAYTLVGNSAWVGDIIESNLNTTGKGRRNSRVPVKDLLARGFKVVAVNFSKEDTLDRVKMACKKGTKGMTTDDILTVSDVNQLVSSIAK